METNILLDTFNQVTSVLASSSLFTTFEGRQQKLEAWLTERGYGDPPIFETNWSAEPIILAKLIVRFLFNKADFYGTGLLFKEVVESESNPVIKQELLIGWEKCRHFLYH